MIRWHTHATSQYLNVVFTLNTFVLFWECWTSKGNADNDGSNICQQPGNRWRILYDT